MYSIFSPLRLIRHIFSFQSTCACNPGLVSNLIVAFFCSASLCFLTNAATVLLCYVNLTDLDTNSIKSFDAGDEIVINYDGGIEETYPLQLNNVNSISLQSKGSDALVITGKFFEAFETSDYDTMKEYCTDSFIDTYFHTNDVYGFTMARIEHIIQDETDNNSIYVFVTVQMQATEESAFYNETETSFYIELQNQEDGRLLLNRIMTGK